MLRGVCARLAALAAALAALLAAPGAGADEPRKVTLEVGASQPLGGYAALCDDATVVSVTLGAQAVVKGLKPGRTLCSVTTTAGGVRQVYEVVVVGPK
jgi:hypothetical protein